MSSIVGAITNSGNGAGYQAQSANILNPATTAQAQTQYQNAQNALAQQQAFLQATQAQNGLGNQSSVYNQLQGVANGQGPNPAQAQLAQSTGANVANQAALMAGQRGAAQNVGLMSRQAAQQGAAAQQQAAGQAASLQANQSLGALGQMGTLAGQQAAQQAAATSANTNAAQGEQGQILNAIAAQNSANVGMQSNINQANASIAQGNQAMQGQILGGLLQGGAAAGAMALAPAAALAKGGSVPMATGGDPSAVVPNVTAGQGPTSSLGKFMQAVQAPPSGGQSSSNLYNGAAKAGQMVGTAIGQGLSNLFSSSPNTNQNAINAGQNPNSPNTGQKAFATGGNVNVLLSPGEKVLTPKEAKAAAEGRARPMALGKTVPGTPKVSGAKNDYANDTVPDVLEAGSLVIPRNVTQAKNAESKAIDFVRAHYANKGSAALYAFGGRIPSTSKKG